MVDFTIASRIGQGVGQNAFAGGGTQMNPLNMMQLMQTMELQRAAEQRALAGESRAQALHAPHLATAQTQAAASALGLKQKQEEDELSNLYAGFRQKYDDPFSDEALKEARKTNAKLYSTLLDQKTAHGKLAAEADVKTAEALTKKLELNKKTADLWLPALESGLVADQQSYSAMRKDLLRGQENLASLFPEEYSPEAVKKFQTAFSGTKNITTQSMAGGDVLVLVGGKPYGLVDPSIKGGDGTMPGVRPFGPGEAPRIPAPAAPTATAPQTMGFSGMGQLAPAGQQAAQNVMAAFPGARITSGLRTPERNSAVGGATSSYHLSGNAIDVVPPAGMPMNVFAAQLQQQLGPQGYTVMYGDPGHLDHVHIQPGAGMNVPRTFSPSVAATDMAAGRQPMGMMAPAAPVNALAPVAAAQIMQQNAMTAPQQALPNIAPGLTQAVAPATGAAPRREDYATYGQFVKAQDEYRTEQRKLAEEQRKAAEERAKESRLPALEKEKATAKVEVETAKKEEDDLKNARNIIDELTKIAAPGGLIEQSTGSVAGRGFDIAASTFGASTEGSRAIARLGPIAARVLMTVPRFEGPQSNIDVQLYQKAAGDLANPTTPRGDRIAAAEEIARLWKKREAEILSKRGEAAPAAAQFTEGQTASNDKGERIIFRGGKWEPLR